MGAGGGPEARGVVNRGRMEPSAGEGDSPRLQSVRKSHLHRKKECEIFHQASGGNPEDSVSLPHKAT